MHASLPQSSRITLGSRLFAVLLLLVLLGATVAQAQLQKAQPISFDAEIAALNEVAVREMPKLDNGLLIAKAQQNDANFGGPYIFAHPHEQVFRAVPEGSWDRLQDGSRVWRLRLNSPGALTLNVGFSKFELPEGARMWLYNAAGDMVQGPWNASHVASTGRFYTPLVYGSEAVLEVHVPAGAADPSLEIERVNHGFRSIDPKQGGCNIDVVCPETAGWEDQIRAIGWYTLNGVGICSGQMVNTVNNSGLPYFLTARHCNLTAGNADTMVVFWNYESPACGQLSGGDLSQNQSGATHLMTHPQTDSTLVELQSDPDPEFNVFYAGIDADGATPEGAVGIHHPSLDEKAFSRDEDTLGVVGVDPDTFFVDPEGDSHWVIEAWDLGTTEGGSSGSCIFDPVTQRCLGVLTGGFASCFNPDGSDYYGKTAFAWEGDGTDESRLSTWLDPEGSGVRSYDGFDPNVDGPPRCSPTDEIMCLQSRRFQVEVDVTDFNGVVRQAKVVQGVGTPESGLFYFFSANNWEMLIKVLDGCNENGNYWVFAATASNVGFDITVTDVPNAETWTFSNPVGTAAPAIFDTFAFGNCSEAGSGE